MQKWFIEPALPEQAKNMTDVGEQHQQGHCIDKRKSLCVARNLMTSVAARPIVFLRSLCSQATVVLNKSRGASTTIEKKSS